MFDHLTTFWLISIGLVIGGATINWSMKKGSRSRWAVVGVAIILGSLSLVSMRFERQLIQEQEAVLVQELTDRFYLTDVWIDLDTQAKGQGNTFRIQSPDGSYLAHFHPRRTEGFKLNEQSGESLRGRRNAHHALYSLTSEDDLEEGWLEYHSPELYTLNHDNEQWHIRLTNQQVTLITDGNGTVRYENMTDEGENAND